MLALLRKENATDLPELGLQLASVRLSEFFFSPQATELLASNPQEYHRRVSDLARLNAEIYKVQKYRDDCAKELYWKYDPERIRRQTERELEQLRKVHSSTRRSNAAKNADTPHPNFLPKDFSQPIEELSNKRK